MLVLIMAGGDCWLASQTNAGGEAKPAPTAYQFDFWFLSLSSPPPPPLERMD